MEAKRDFYRQRGPDRVVNKQQPQRQQVLLLGASASPGLELLLRWQVSTCAKELGVSPGNLVSICKVAIPLLNASVSRVLLIPLEGGLQHTMASVPLALHCLKTPNLSYSDMAGYNSCGAEEIKRVRTGPGAGQCGIILTLVPSPHTPTLPAAAACPAFSTLSVPTCPVLANTKGAPMHMQAYHIPCGVAGSAVPARMMYEQTHSKGRLHLPHFILQGIQGRIERILRLISLQAPVWHLHVSAISLHLQGQGMHGLDWSASAPPPPPPPAPRHAGCGGVLWGSPESASAPPSMQG